MNHAHNDREPIVITRQNGTAAVLMSLDDFNAYEETAYLSRSPENAKRLRQSIAAVKKGLVIKRKLLTTEKT